MHVQKRTGLGGGSMENGGLATGKADGRTDGSMSTVVDADKPE
jgi:hypothetical protein